MDRGWGVYTLHETYKSIKDLVSCICDALNHRSEKSLKQIVIHVISLSSSNNNGTRILVKAQPGSDM